MSAPLLVAEGVGKKHVHDLRRALRYAAQDTFADALGRRSDRELRSGEFWALRDVSLDVRPGEALAVVGGNGAGKSTLLKLLLGLLQPDRGHVRRAGRVEGVLELGIGVVPALTGRENVRTLAAVHGLSRKGADALLERVADFSELGAALDDPVQNYSSGMSARLAYSLMAQVESDVLLVDEVLAVGDFAFQRKCLAHMLGFLDRGGALVLVSHTAHQVQSVCSRGLVLERGEQVFTGTAVEALEHYVERQPAPAGRSAPRLAGPDRPVVIQEVTASAADGRPVVPGSEVLLRLRVSSDRPRRVVTCFSVVTADGQVAVTGDCDVAGRELVAGETTITCRLPELPLQPGHYVVRGSVNEAIGRPLDLFGYTDAGCPLHVRSSGPSALDNVQRQQGHLVQVRADWS